MGKTCKYCKRDINEADEACGKCAHALYKVAMSLVAGRANMKSDLDIPMVFDKAQEFMSEWRNRVGMVQDVEEPEPEPEPEQIESNIEQPADGSAPREAQEDDLPGVPDNQS